MSIGLNQVTDIEIDKINKPYLPLASGKLTKTNGIIIITSSLLISLFMIFILYKNTISSFLQITIIGSGILGTLYSLSPFRLKKYPLLAAFCILVVRGSLVNMGFFLEAKIALQQIMMTMNLQNNNNNHNMMTIIMNMISGLIKSSSTTTTAAAVASVASTTTTLNLVASTTTAAATATTTTAAAAAKLIPNLLYSSSHDIYQSFKLLIHQYPESIILNSFFAIFGLVIAIMKDVPDIRGDLIYKIPSFSVKLGAKKMFRIAYRLLYSLLGITSFITFLSFITTSSIATSIATSISTSTILNGNNLISSLISSVSLRFSSLFSSILLSKSIKSVLQNTSLSMKLLISILFFIMTYDVRSRAKKIEAENPDKVFSYYMHIWNIFYLCYLILPLMHF